MFISVTKYLVCFTCVENKKHTRSVFVCCLSDCEGCDSCSKYYVALDCCKPQNEQARKLSWFEILQFSVATAELLVYSGVS